MTLNWMAAALGLAAMIGTAPARAADVATAECVRANLDAAAAATLSEGMGEPDTDSDAIGSDAAYDKVDEAITLCREKHGWSDDAVEDALIYVISTLGVEGVSAMMQSAGLDPLLAAKAYGALPAEDVALLSNDPESERVASIVLGAAADVGLPSDTERRQQLLASYASYTAQKIDALQSFGGH